MLLSVVIPYYHVEKYLGECLERTAKLDLSSCEILLVDDCGKDGSAAIAQRYCAEHENARIICRAQNGGLSAARNTGLDEAKGEYVYFLDSDDLVEPYALTALALEAKAKELDIAKARFVYFDDETGKETRGPAIAQTDVMTGAALFAQQSAEGTYEPMVWQCVYRREFLAGHALSMAEGLLFEDELFQAPALMKAERAAAYEMSILHYRQREGSIMRSFAKSARWCPSYLEVCRRLNALAQELEAGAPRAQLKKRVGQIALSVVKNIGAYRLTPQAAADAMRFAAQHKKELSGYAIASGDALVMAQGILMRVSLRAFALAYSVNKP